MQPKPSGSGTRPFLRRNKNMAVEEGTVSHYYILVLRKFIDFILLFRHVVWFSFSVKTISLWNMQHIALRIADKNRRRVYSGMNVYSGVIFTAVSSYL